MAGVLVDQPVACPHRQRRRPRTCVHRRIVDREPVIDCVVGDSTEAFDDAERGRIGGKPERRVLVKIRGLDHERIAFPVAARVAQPLPDTRADVRTPVEVNEPHLVNLLMQNRHESRRLRDLVVVVVPGRQRRHAVVQDAAFLQRPVKPGVGRTPGSPRGRARIEHLLTVRRQRRQPSVLRVDDERCAADRRTAVPPELVIRQLEILGFVGGAALGAGVRLLVDFGFFFLAEQLLLSGTARALERRDRAVIPGPL